MEIQIDCVETEDETVNSLDLSEIKQGSTITISPSKFFSKDLESFPRRIDYEFLNR